MSYEPPADAFCAEHPEAAATAVCPRCGTFVCRACERRTRPEAVPMCPECWDRRVKVVDEREGRRAMWLPNTVLGLGVAALIPCIWPLQVGAVVVGLWALSRLGPDSPPSARTRIWIGMGLGALGLGLSALVMLGVFSSAP